MGLEHFLQLNTEKRKHLNKDLRRVFKLINSWCYGKTSESNLNRVTVKLIRMNRDVSSETDRHLCNTCNIFDENLASVSFKTGLSEINQHPLEQQFWICQKFIYMFPYQVMKNMSAAKCSIQTMTLFFMK